MNLKIITWSGIILIVVTGLIHLMNARSEYDEATYMGFLFIGNFLCTLFAAYGIFRNHPLGWVLGFFIAAGSIVGYVWSRTLGMPGMDVEEWLTPSGITAMVVEGLFIVLFILRPWKIKTNPLVQPGT